MGDFDRKEAPTSGAKQNKQMVIAIVLGAVLVGVVGYHFTKGGPQSADAASIAISGPMPALAPDESVDSAANALKVDPYKPLLQPRENDPVLEKTPHNPFVMDEGWRASLIKPKPEVPVVQTTGPKLPAVVHIEPLGIRIEAYKLGSIMVGSGKPTAIINGRIVSAGMIVDGARVLEITNEHVLLQNAEFPNGPTSELTMQPKLK